MSKKLLFNVFAVHPTKFTRIEADAVLTPDEALEVTRQLDEMGFDEVSVLDVHPPCGPMGFAEVVQWYRRQR